MKDQLTTKEKTISSTREEIIKEAKRIEENSLYTSKGHFAAAQFWTNFNLWIGIPTVILSAIAGILAFAKDSFTAAIVAIVVTILIALSTFVNPKEKANIHLTTGNNYDSLLSRIRIFWAIECQRGDSDELLTKHLKSFSEERDRLNRDSPQVPRWAYNRAIKGIEGGEADYKINKLEI